MDTRTIVFVLSLILLLLCAYKLLKKSSPLLYVLLLLALMATILSVKENFLTYDVREIVFHNDGHKLYGTLYTPKSTTTSCLVVFIHGSGSEPRKEYAFHARNLARQGIASFAYDKRGSGKSGGNTYEVGYQGYAQDAMASIAAIKSQYEFEKIGLFAVSEGEWVGLIVDSKTEIDFIVMLSASGTTPLKNTVREMTYRLESKGFSKKDITEAEKLYTDILTFDNDSIRRNEIEASINKAKDKPWFEEGEEFSEELYYYPWWIDVMNFQPSTYLQKTKTPILVLAGKNNEIYPSNETVTNFKNYNNVETKIFEEGDHDMLKWRLGKGVPPPSFVAGYLESYSKWIINQCAKN